MSQVVKSEEERFLETVDRGLELLNQEIAKLGKGRSFPERWFSVSTIPTGFRSISPRI